MRDELSGAGRELRSVPPNGMSVKEHVKSARAAAEGKKYDSLKIICENGLALEPGNMTLLAWHGLACTHTGDVRPRLHTRGCSAVFVGI